MDFSKIQSTSLFSSLTDTSLACKDWVTKTENFFVRHNGFVDNNFYQVIKSMSQDQMYFISLHLDVNLGKCKEKFLENTKDWKLSLSELKELPIHSMYCTLKCPKSNLIRDFKDLSDQKINISAVGNAQWSGISLRDVLERHIENLKDISSEDILKEAFIVFKGRDKLQNENMTSKQDQYRVCIPLKMIYETTILLAYEMNHKPLTLDHGFPIRVIVPGMASACCKWLSSITITNSSQLQGNIPDLPKTMTHPSPIQTECVICEPTLLEGVIQNENHRNSLNIVRGYAYSGIPKQMIQSVEISWDGGSKWVEANLFKYDDGFPNEYSWILFQANLVPSTLRVGDSYCIQSRFNLETKSPKIVPSKS